MKIGRLRGFVQVFSFILLTYGGYMGLKLGHFLPCFSCPYVSSCSGHCYLMALQSPFLGLELGLKHIWGIWGIRIFKMFLGFLILTLLLSKSWCGWICPFGTLQEWFTIIRNKFAIRESLFSWKFRDSLKPIKYILLILLTVLPVLIGNGILHKDFTLPFCQICPAKPLMPLFEGKFQYMAIDMSNTITTTMTTISIILAASILIGFFYKDRFFCLFCPTLAFISLFQRIGLLQLKKKADSCRGCGNCQRICPVEIRKVHTERENGNVFDEDCILCLQCIESCPQDDALTLTALGKNLFSSSRKYYSKHNVKTEGS
ncbi:MAG: 4Fe-4S binding protein [Chitinispirillia bacterium]|jgi:polyferredoxin